MVNLAVADEFSTLNAVVAEVAPLPLIVVCPPCKKVVPFTFRVFVGVVVPIPTFPLELINKWFPFVFPAENLNGPASLIIHIPFDTAESEFIQIRDGRLVWLAEYAIMVTAAPADPTANCDEALVLVLRFCILAANALLILSLTSNFCVGVTVPIPTLPLELIVILTEPLVSNCRF